jgi:hypothetical protein
MQSTEFEFGCCDGYEHASISTPPPVSPGVTQQDALASFTRQHAALFGHPAVSSQMLPPTWFGSRANGSSAVSDTLHVEPPHATTAPPVQRSGALSVQV